MIDWTEAMDRQVENLADRNMTAKGIADVIGKGVSAADVSVRAQKLNVRLGGIPPRRPIRQEYLPMSSPSRFRNSGMSLKRAGQSPSKPRPVRKAPVLPPLSLHIPPSYLGRNDCRWLGSDGTYCGHAITRGSYCEYHANVGYNNYKPQTEDA